MRRAVLAVPVVALLAGCGQLRGAVTTSSTGAPTSSTVATTRPPPLALTTTTSAAPPPETTPPFTAAPGLPVPDALRLGEGGLGRARFGIDAPDAETYFRSVLGAPDGDTDWGDPDTEFGRCPGTTARVMQWGQLLVVFTDRSPYGDGRRHFSGWRYGPGVNADAYYPELLAMSNGLAPGAGVVDVQLLYPGGVVVTGATASTPAIFRVGTSFGGWLTGIDPAAVVTALDAGAVCRP